VTVVTGLFIAQEKQKQKQKKRNIKSRKIDKKKRKSFQVQTYYNILDLMFLKTWSEKFNNHLISPDL